MGKKTDAKFLIFLKGTLIIFKINVLIYQELANLMSNYVLTYIIDKEKLYTAVRPVTEDDES